MYRFEKAIPVWGVGLTHEYNQVLGFRADVEAGDSVRMKVALAARTYYRLYINGAIRANGPARTAHGFCRVDEFVLPAKGLMQIAIEVIACDMPVKYSNDNTMEPGLLAAEVSLEAEDGAWTVAAATGEDFRYTELLYRSSMAEMMSHCRGILEHYRLEEDSLRWIAGAYDGFRLPVPLQETVSFLKRRAPYPTYRRIPFRTLHKVKNLRDCGKRHYDVLYNMAQRGNPEWYALLKEEDRFIGKLLQERDMPFGGSWHRQGQGEEKEICVTDCHGAAAFVFSIPQSEVGFLQFRVRTQEDAVIDVLSSDHTDGEGAIRGNTYAARYELKKGNYSLTTFEPRLARYVKLVIRSAGQVVFSYPRLLDYTYPEEDCCGFQCSDGELNLIYEGAKRTLRLNTLDIFMDCPERERSGWLCDSYFTAKAAWQLFGDLRVERDFLENFMLTGAEDYREAYFPAAYPSAKRDPKDGGIQSWSFWLLAQLWEYYRRSGDRAFIDGCFGRVEKMLDNLMEHVGESGLFEDFPSLFVDWSLSNRSFCVNPISIPSNCHIVYIYEVMGELYGVERWKEIAQRVRVRIGEHWLGARSDGYSYADGRFVENGCLTESGRALELWSGFGTDDAGWVKPFVEAMGTSPRLRPDPNVGKSDIFIGLIVRFDVLAKLGKTAELVRELRELYLPQLLQGPGTLYEHVNESNGCHGMNGVVGSLLVNQALGLGEPLTLTRTVRIAPHPGGLAWACGSAACGDGEIYLEWRADHDAHVLDMDLALPEGWTPQFDFPFALSGWKIRVNGAWMETEGNPA